MQRISPRSVRLALLVCCLALLGVALLDGALAWRVAYLGGSAKESVQAARSDARKGDVTAARRDVDRAAGRLASARALTRSLPWRLSAAVPVLGAQLHLPAQIVESSDAVVRSARPVLDTAASLQGSPNSVPGGVDLAKVRRLVDQLGRLDHALQVAQVQVRRAPAGPLAFLGDRLRARYLAVLDPAAAVVDEAARVGRVVPGLLGADGPRRYLLAVQNPAEARGTGGSVTGYGLLQVHGGRLTVVRSGINTDFGDLTGGLGFQQAYADLVAGGARRDRALRSWLGVNVAPDWPTVADRMGVLWQEHFHEKLDGVVGITPEVLGWVLDATGPVTLAGGIRVTGADAVDFVQVRQYAVLDASRDRRKSSNSELAEKALSGLATIDLSLPVLRHLFPTGSAGRDWLFASSHAPEEHLLRSLPLGGAISDKPGFLQITEQNVAGGKMDAFVERTTSITRVPRGDRCQGEAQVVLHNTGGPGPLSPSQALRADPETPAYPRGTTRTLLTLHLSPEADVAGTVRVDGQDVPTTVTTEQDHPQVTVDLVLPPGKSRRVTVAWTEPESALAYRAARRARTEHLTVHDSCAPSSR